MFTSCVHTSYHIPTYMKIKIQNTYRHTQIQGVCIHSTQTYACVGHTSIYPPRRYTHTHPHAHVQTHTRTIHTCTSGPEVAIALMVSEPMACTMLLNFSVSMFAISWAFVISSSFLFPNIFSLRFSGSCQPLQF